MVVIDEEKLDEMIRRAVKEEMISILTSTGKVMDYIIGVASKSGREVLPLERESTPTTRMFRLRPSMPGSSALVRRET